MNSIIPVPISQSERIQSIDVIRGFALMGILAINIQGTAMPWSTVESNPASYGDMTGVNLFVWWMTFLFFNMKMINLFSMLFGAGLAIMTERLDAKNAPTFLLYYRRTFFLLLIGAFHAYLMWDGDILFIYAWCAFAAYWFRKLPPAWLVVFGLLIFLIKFGVRTLEYYEVLAMSPDQLKKWTIDKWDQTGYVLWALFGYRGDFWANLNTRIQSNFEWHINEFALNYFWAHPLGMMVLGMGLYKWGVFSGTRSFRFYRNLTILGFSFGLAITSYGAWRLAQSNWDGVIGKFIGYRLLYFAAPMISLGWVGLIAWLYKSGKLNKIVRRYAAAGQMALTNYLMQTVICTYIFYGFGLGFYGYLERWQLMLIVISIWIFQLILSPVWLRYFRFGPVEWLWRTLTYWKIQPIRR